LSKIQRVSIDVIDIKYEVVTNEVFQGMWYMPDDFIPKAISELIGINLIFPLE
jgi:hypothetical protein